MTLTREAELVSRQGSGILALGSEEEVVAAPALVAGETYTIVEADDTDFTVVGAKDSAAGTVFTATGAGVGAGIALLQELELLTNQQMVGEALRDYSGNEVG